MTGLCLVAGLLVVPLGDEVTVRWTHSIEKILWEEDWRREGERLRLVAARVRGTGAGMEPPAGAVLKDGIWHFAPALPPQSRILLRHSPYAPAYTFCSAGRCLSADVWLPGLDEEAVLELAPCRRLCSREGAIPCRGAQRSTPAACDIHAGEQRQPNDEMTAGQQ